MKQYSYLILSRFEFLKALCLVRGVEKVNGS